MNTRGHHSPQVWLAQHWPGPGFKGRKREEKDPLQTPNPSELSNANSLRPHTSKPPGQSGSRCWGMRECEMLVARSCLTPATPRTVARQAPLSMGFSRQEYWSGLLFPPPGNLPDPGIEPGSLRSPALADGFFTTSATREAVGKRELQTGATGSALGLSFSVL